MVPPLGNMLTYAGIAQSRRDRIVSTPERFCPMCKRVQLLSGEERCAIHVKATMLAAHHKEFDTKQFSGSSPPGVFVGRFGYRKVFVGPMVPPVSGDTEILDTPEWWMGKGFDEIVDFRNRLILDSRKANGLDAPQGGRCIQNLPEAPIM